ncbi:PAS domain-containing protein [Sphingomonas floccifaciens]
MLLAGQGYDAQVFADLAQLASAIDASVGVVLVTEEAFRVDMAALRARLDAQPAWSDIPFVILSVRRTGSTRADEAVRAKLSSIVGNAIVLERPIGSASLTSAIASAMRSRQKQFEMRDRLSELERGREALAASEAELRLVADSLPVLIGFIDSDLRYRFANRAYEDWFYLSPKDVVGRSVRDVVGDEGFAVREAGMRAALAGEPVQLFIPWPHRDGRRREAEIRYLPHKTASGAVDGFHVFVLDVTERRKTEEELEARVAERTEALTTEMDSRSKAEAALRQSQKMEAVGQLTGGIAHDFNNMLTGVIGALDIMRRRIAAGQIDDLDRFMDAASKSAHRAAGLTARLLAFSRRQSLDSKSIDANRLIGELEDLMRRTIRENISLRIVPGPDVPFAVADANQLESAILNLAINARDAMPDGGQLTIETSVVELDDAYSAATPDVKPGRYVVVAVSDTGVGMAPELLEKIFDPFFTTKPIGQGTGLGLSMVYGFARQSGGQVRVHSQPGVGTSVKIYLPAGQVIETDDTPRPDVVPEGRGQTVLLVEDDPSVRLLVRDLLEELSYTTIEAEDADHAIPILASDRPIDLMVSDVGLPGMNGRQLAEIARQNRPALPVLFLTGYAENAAIRAGFLGTNMAMITKPFAMDALAGKIAEMLEPPRSA